MAKQPSALALARREAAASIQWPEKTGVLLNPDPAVVRRLVTRPAIVAAVLIGLYFILMASHGPVDSWSRAVEEARMRPAMEAAMAHGNRAAGTWLAIRFPQEHPGLLEEEANAGEPSAMFSMGLVLHSGSGRRFFKLDPALSDVQLKENGRGLILKAADAQNQDALKFAVQHGWTNH